MVQNATGTNFFDKDTGIFTFIIKGGVTIDVKTSKSIIISFGIQAMTPEEFFGDNLVENIASFLNIPLTKVRIVSVVSASASGKRKRRSSEGVEVTIEIADEPATGVDFLSMVHFLFFLFGPLIMLG
ncbi:hypothetical protein DPMN_079569 [Dreissena polymorpha]|uniref:Uncharacterized protein n=1 Tax=Dreissena polymorpha TaxID=45954 RepID=A0A9D3YSF1_DREPO|nr:hypothetical protein DPMN_079569 [Dreissena polymorpha]